MKKTEERIDRLERIAKLLVRAGLRARREMRQQDDSVIGLFGDADHGRLALRGTRVPKQD